MVLRDYSAALLPRAVAYSRELLNYFFRGNIDLVSDPNNPAGYLIKNLTDEAMSGTFEIWYDDAAGKRPQVPIGGVTWPITLDPRDDSSDRDQVSVSFSEPTNPTPAKPGEYILMFKGQLGVEGDPESVDEFVVVGRVVQVCHPRVMDVGAFNAAIRASTIRRTVTTSSTASVRAAACGWKRTSRS